MDNTNIAPVDHGVLSATGNVAAGAGVGFVKTGLKAMGGWVLALAAIGAGIGLIASVGVGGLLGSMLLGGVIGGGLGAISAPFTAGPVGAALGAFMGGNHAIKRVAAEKGAANVMQAQVEAYKAEAQAQAFAAANDNRGFPAQGSAMNPAGTTINNFSRDGLVASNQLQRA